MADIEIEDFHALMNVDGDFFPTALQDARDLFPGGSVAAYREQSKIDKPHWFRTRPISDEADVLYSPDAQARYVKDHGEAALAALLAPHGLKVGQRKKRPPADASKPAPNNVFSDTFKGTDAERQAKIAAMIKAMGAAKVAAIAASAGRRIDGTLLPKKH